MSSDIQPGDLVQKVSGSNRFMPVGRIERVSDICLLGHPDEAAHGSGGLLFDGYLGQSITFCDCFNPAHFRKLNDEPDNITLVERIKACRPVKQRQSV